MKRTLLLLALVLGFITEALACKCAVVASAETAITESFKNSKFVISGKVKTVKDSLTKGPRIVDAEGAYWRLGGYNAVIKVNRVYKGKGEIKNIIEITPNWSNCSQYFNLDETYVIFGYVNEKGEFTTSVRSGNFKKGDGKKWQLLQKIAKK